MTDFYNNLIYFAKKLRQKETGGIVGESSGHAGTNTEHYQNQHGGYGYRNTNKGEKMILKFCVAIKMTEGDTLFKRG